MTSRGIAAVAVCLMLALSTCQIAVGQSSAPAKQYVKDLYPGLASGALELAKPATLPMGVLLRSGEVKITQKELDAEIAKASESVRAQLKNNAFFVLENRVTGPLITAEAKAWAKRIELHPRLPEWLREVAIRNLRIGNARVDFMVDHQGVRDVSVRGEPELEVVSQ